MPRNLAQEPTYANPLETYHLHSDTLPKKTVQMDGKGYLWLGGTNYLGIGDHPLFQEKLKEDKQLQLLQNLLTMLLIHMESILIRSTTRSHLSPTVCFVTLKEQNTAMQVF